MQVGDLVKYYKYVGIVTRIDPEELGDEGEVEVIWSDGESTRCSEYASSLEVISASR